MTRVLLADDHRMLRAGLRSLLEQRPELTIVGEAGSGREAMELARTLRPDVVIMDVGMPDLNGVEATRQIRRELPAARIIGLSTHADRSHVLEMLSAGASAYVLKIAAYEELIEAIDAVLRGDRFLSPRITGSVVEAALSKAEEKGEEPAAAERALLGHREREILQLVAEGYTSGQIGKTLHISARTVDTHRRNIMRKLGVHNVAELTKWAIREGITFLEA